jgi:hypothetical protein
MHGGRTAVVKVGAAGSAGRICNDRHRFRADPATARRYRVVSLVTHAAIPDIVWAEDETGCYRVRSRDVKRQTDRHRER